LLSDAYTFVSFNLTLVAHISVSDFYFALQGMCEKETRRNAFYWIHYKSFSEVVKAPAALYFEYGLSNLAEGHIQGHTSCSSWENL